MEDPGVVVVAVVGILQHVLQVADDARGVQVRPARRDEGLVHVQGAGEARADAAEVDAAGEMLRQGWPPHHRAHGVFVAREVGHTVDRLGPGIIHGEDCTGSGLVPLSLGVHRIGARSLGVRGEL